MYTTEQTIEKVILVAIDDEKGDMTVEQLLDELGELVITSGAEVVGRLTQKMSAPHTIHYLGKGKLEELSELIKANGATGIVCDDELTNTQQKKLIELLNIKVMDRTMLILDIFAARATSAEGMVQVELAQLRYNSSHLTGMGKSLTRQGGGIGTRGPGEKKLEIDKRRIRERISELNRDLREIETHRGIMREKRRKTGIPVISLVGYTNSGKSTLMNTLTEAGVLSENKLFATLDTTTRKLTLLGGSEVLLTDTVGFIQKLPHSLIKAFKATLEEMNYADILLHVVDSSSPVFREQMRIVHNTLVELNYRDKEIITVMNKIDLLNEEQRLVVTNKNDDKSVCISAKEGIGIEGLKEKIEVVLKSFRSKTTVLIPYHEGKLIHLLHSSAEILKEEHRENGTYIEAYVDPAVAGRLQNFSYDA